MDYDKLFGYGVDSEYVYTVVEIPRDSSLKIEFDRDKKAFILDRVEPAIFKKPVNYGFIPGTTDEDGDPLDTLVISEEPIPTGVVVKARVVAVLDFVDDGENDYKIICVPEDDRHSGKHIKGLEDLTDQWKQQIEYHFNHYKDLKKVGTTNVRSWGDSDMAWKIIRECSERFE
ncbi:MAG TPA: inorganic diphosphatase [Candidatus Saccharimonadales bacterium]